jgi:hypothetical protein
VTPEAAVDRLAEIITSRAEPNEDDIYSAMADAGIPVPLADRAYKFTQIALGRVFLDGLGIQFSPEYFCLDGAGNVMESGLLTQQPYFVAAIGLAQRYVRSPAFPKFAVMSADVNAVNNALHAGSKPEDLVMGTAVLFMEAATPAGIEKAREFLSQRLAAANGTDDTGGRRADLAKKSWWRFW